jgi:hypothetical protein
MYSQLLAVIDELGKDIRPTYAGNRMSQERVKRYIVQVCGRRAHTYTHRRVYSCANVPWRRRERQHKHLTDTFHSSSVHLICHYALQHNNKCCLSYGAQATLDRKMHALSVFVVLQLFKHGNHNLFFRQNHLNEPEM